MNHQENEINGRAYYTARDLILYAFGIGCSPKEDVNELRYLYEHDKKIFSAFPTFLLSLPFRANTIQETNILRGFGMPDFPPPLVDLSSLVSKSFKAAPLIHLGQSFRLHQPLPTCTAENDYQTPIAVDIKTRLIDCKKHKLGTVMITETNFYHCQEKEKKIHLATAQMTSLIPGQDLEIKKGDRGSKMNASALHPILISKMDFQKTVATAYKSKRYGIDNNQALLYRLTGDSNKIHVEGAPGLFHTTQPILHGLCTLGYAVRAILSTYGKDRWECTYVNCFFKKPVFVGDEIEVRVWEFEKYINGEKIILFQVYNTQTGKIVVDQGIVGLSENMKLKRMPIVKGKL
ncbi:hypothetical protein CTEN210_06670 [Chaetoceros tenuissimus]|uniref:MaoC-like domain-containing protein n=1 Tax=Chaetoceros tenuissimus TaxID=426638 RepID=A0AAD3H514_9STRA|nr:hypothetical protein CTEN210_06670 [Chaetoceros tenuissimus]